MEPISSILGTYNLLHATQLSYEALAHVDGLPPAFGALGKHLALVKDTLDSSADALHHQRLSAADSDRINDLLNRCWQSSQALMSLFTDLEAACRDQESLAAAEVYAAVLHTRGQDWWGHRVEALMADVLRSIQQMIDIPVFVESTGLLATRIQGALQQLAQMEPSA